ncbi:MAG: NYN domain-containing protein [Acidobacteriia bacterium]|nr:NYN domain-containing protein [Terriglobia bacterium]
MPWLLDGNNLARGKEREAVRRAALAVARHERVRILVFFDGAPPNGTGAVERLGPVEVRYVGDADTAIAAFLHQKGRGWRVATDDRELGRRVIATGAEVLSAVTFWQKAAAASTSEPEERGGRSSGAAEDLDYLRDSRQRLPDAPVRIPRRRRRPRDG